MRILSPVDNLGRLFFGANVLLLRIERKPPRHVNA
jgi:hypothetical protein